MPSVTLQVDENQAPTTLMTVGFLYCTRFQCGLILCVIFHVLLLFKQIYMYKHSTLIKTSLITVC